MREASVALVSVNLEINPLKLGAADDENFKVGRFTQLLALQRFMSSIM